MSTKMCECCKLHFQSTALFKIRSENKWMCEECVNNLILELSDEIDIAYVRVQLVSE